MSSFSPNQRLEVAKSMLLNIQKLSNRYDRALLRTALNHHDFHEYQQNILKLRDQVLTADGKVNKTLVDEITSPLLTGITLFAKSGYLKKLDTAIEILEKLIPEYSWTEDHDTLMQMIQFIHEHPQFVHILDLHLLDVIVEITQGQKQYALFKQKRLELLQQEGGKPVKRQINFDNEAEVEDVKDSADDQEAHAIPTISQGKVPSIQASPMASAKSHSKLSSVQASPMPSSKSPANLSSLYASPVPSAQSPAKLQSIRASPMPSAQSPEKLQSIQASPMPSAKSPAKLQSIQASPMQTAKLPSIQSSPMVSKISHANLPVIQASPMASEKSLTKSPNKRQNTIETTQPSQNMDIDHFPDDASSDNQPEEPEDDEYVSAKDDVSYVASQEEINPDDLTENQSSLDQDNEDQYQDAQQDIKSDVIDNEQEDYEPSDSEEINIFFFQNRRLLKFNPSTYGVQDMKIDFELTGREVFQQLDNESVYICINYDYAEGFIWHSNGSIEELPPLLKCPNRTQFSVAYHNEKLYIFGGINLSNSDQFISDAECFDLNNQIWSILPQIPNTQIVNTSIFSKNSFPTCVNNGKIYFSLMNMITQYNIEQNVYQILPISLPPGLPHSIFMHESNLSILHDDNTLYTFDLDEDFHADITYNYYDFEENFDKDFFLEHCNSASYIDDDVVYICRTLENYFEIFEIDSETLQNEVLHECNSPIYYEE